MIKRNSHTGTRTRVAEVKTRYPNRLDYMGPVCSSGMNYKRDLKLVEKWIVYKNESTLFNMVWIEFKFVISRVRMIVLMSIYPSLRIGIICKENILEQDILIWQNSIFFIFSFSYPFSEWAVNMHRDTYASHIGHEDMLYFASIAENESIERVRYTMLEVYFSLLFFICLEDVTTLWTSTS